jgi:hypothetical protein
MSMMRCNSCDNFIDTDYCSEGWFQDKSPSIRKPKLLVWRDPSLSLNPAFRRKRVRRHFVRTGTETAKHQGAA